MTTTHLTIGAIETPTLDDRSYVVHDGAVAFVDPQRDIDRVLAILDEHAVHLTDVFETHLHNDYVTGGPALAAIAARRITSTSKTRRLRPDPGPCPGHHGDWVLDAGHSGLTPGHTATHLFCALSDASPISARRGWMPR